jgi:hypothetical protein
MYKDLALPAALSRAPDRARAGARAEVECLQ